MRQSDIYLQHREGRRLRRGGSLELRQPVPSLSGVPADLAEESPDVAVNQISVGRRMSVRGGQTAQRVLLMQQQRVFPRVPGHVGAHHAASRCEHPPLPLAGTPGQRRERQAGQVLSCQGNGPAAGGAAVEFSHVEAFPPWVPGADC